VTFTPRFLVVTSTLLAIAAAFSCMPLSINAKTDSNRYTVLMDALGKSGQVIPQKLDDFEEFLVSTGTSRYEAQEAISEALRAPFLNASAVLQIVPLVRDISAVMGTNIVLETHEFLGSFGHGGEAAIRYCIARNALNAEEIIKLRYMDQHSQSLKALEEAVDRLQKRFGGSYERLRKSNTQ
jgi:hypothetical protein